jgi:hypothetical protein
MIFYCKKNESDSIKETETYDRVKLFNKNWEKEETPVPTWYQGFSKTGLHPFSPCGLSGRQR